MSNTLLAQAEASTSAVQTTSSPRRPSKRRLSTSFAQRLQARSSCQALPSPIGLGALDLSSTAPGEALAYLRLQVLTYLADLEARLSALECPLTTESVMSKGECTMEATRAWVQTALQMLESIRADVSSHLPDFNLESASVELLSHMPDVPNLEDVRAHLPTMPESVRSRLPDIDIQDVRSRIEDVRHLISDIDFRRPLEYIPTLSEHLRSLHAHLTSMDISQLSDSVVAPSTSVYDLIDKALTSELFLELSADIRGGEEKLENAAREIARAMARSLDGSRLIHYMDLPEMWRNNPFVTRGYRFIPLQQWPRLLLSMFSWHNETVNIHTHFIPFLLWSLNLIPVAPIWTNPVNNTSREMEPAIAAFSIFSLLCLFTSSLWHTMAGCAHPKGMQLCAQIDYVGIGWLISASIGSILPFMDWFNKVKYRGYRIAFFVSLALGAIAPLAYLSQLHTITRMFQFIGPLVPSLLSYIAGLVFYATHFPECVVVRAGKPHWLDWFGGGSHAIWHVFVVCAISTIIDALNSRSTSHRLTARFDIDITVPPSHSLSTLITETLGTLFIIIIYL
ncbi:hypothetical protein ABKN59_011579 [Abortiporus biennis]